MEQTLFSPHERASLLSNAEEHVVIDGLDRHIESYQEALDGLVLASFSHRPKEFAGETQDGWVLCVNNTAHEQAGTYGDIKRARRVIGVDELSIAGPHMPFEVECFGNKHITTSYLWMDQARLRALVPESYQGQCNFHFLGQEHFRSDIVMRLLENLFAEARQGYAFGPLYTEAMVTAIVAELLRLNQTPLRALPNSAAGLSLDQLKRIDAFIDATPHGTLSSQVLAGQLDLPAAAFARCLKAAKNMTPYQYVLARRLDKAQQLIRHSNQSLAQIAFACGFSSQSHMTDVFRGRLGVTPGALRAQLKS